MKFILLTIFSFLIVLTPIQVNKDTFKTEVNNGYNTYCEILEKDTEAYSLNIVIGEYNETIYYSFVFTSSVPNEYDVIIKLEDDNVNYISEEDSRGDSIVYFLEASQEMDLVVLKENNEVFSYDLNAHNMDTYSNTYKSNVIQGNNEGLLQTNIKGNGTSNSVFIVSIVFASIILVCVIVMIIFYISKKGLFNKDNLEKTLKDDPYYNMFTSGKQNIEVENERNVFEVEAEEIIDEPVKDVYEKNMKYDFDEERDISELLKQKGFDTNYSSLSTDDKNKIMLELMKMKEFNEITNEEYRAEVIKLWM